MAGILKNIRFLCALLFFMGITDVTKGWSVWSDPELANIEPQKNNHQVKEVSADVGKHRARSSLHPILFELKIAIGKLMFVSGMQNFNLPPGERRSVSLTMNLNDMDLDDINNFLSQPDEMTLLKVSKVMQRIFSPHSPTYKEEAEAWFKDEKTIIETKEQWVQIIFNIIMSCTNKETMLVVTCLIMAVFLVRAMIFGADIRVVIGLFFVAVFFAGFLWNWCYMYQKAVVDQFVKRQQYSKFASSCTPDASFWSFVMNLFGYAPTLDECTEFYRATSIDPLIMVPPTIALSETISMFVIHPAVLMADSMQKITRILFGNQIWGMYIGTPIVMLVFGGMFLFMFIMFTGRRIKIKLMYIGEFEVGSQFETFYHHLPSTKYAQIKEGPEESKAQKTIPITSQSSASTTTDASNGNTETNSSSNRPASSNPTTASQNPSTSTCKVGHSSIFGASGPTCTAGHCSNIQPVSCLSHAHSHCGHHSPTVYQCHPSGNTRHDPFRNHLDDLYRGSKSRVSPLRDLTNHNKGLRQRRGLSNRSEEVEDTFVMFRRRKLSI
ncbi:hypothetical protein WDU94_003755 [Cyamophila willieti]